MRKFKERTYFDKSLEIKFVRINNTDNFIKIYSLWVDMEFSVSEWKIKHAYHFLINRKYSLIKIKMSYF